VFIKLRPVDGTVSNIAIDGILYYETSPDIKENETSLTVIALKGAIKTFAVFDSTDEITEKINAATNQLDRNQIAAMAMQGLLSLEATFDTIGYEQLAVYAFKHADAFIETAVKPTGFSTWECQ
jgi:hypothetical protein